MKNFWLGLHGGVKMVLIAGLIFGLGYFAFSKGWMDSILKTKKTTANTSANEKLSSDEQGDVRRIGVVTFAGYAGGEYFNEGFKASKESRFYKDYGMLVEFVLIDDFNASREAFKSGKIDLLWQTADAFPTESPGMSDLNPQVSWQSDWSRGADAIVSTRTIKSAQDLRGKTIAVAPMTPSQTFLLNALSASNLTMDDVTIKEVANAIDAADLFKKGQVDAAVVWSPDDEDCVKQVKGSRILMSTATAKNIIADVFMCKKEFFDNHFDELVNIYEGWMIGAREINADKNGAREKAAQILADGLNSPIEFCRNGLSKVRLCTHGDNKNFFNTNFDGVNGEELYSTMSTMFTKAGVIKGKIPSWRLVSNSDVVTAAEKRGKLNTPEDAAEGATKFQPISNEVAEKMEAISSKKVSITFNTGSFSLSDDAKQTIDEEFGQLSKGFSGARIRVEGNTDNTGNAAQNKTLSRQRAQAVADYLIRTYNFDENRLIVVGNGSNKPVDDNSTTEGKKANRRTDFEFISE